MESWGRNRGDGSRGTKSWGREHGNGKLFSSYDSTDFLYWHDSVGVASDYLFSCLFLDDIFWLGMENFFTLHDSYGFFHIGMKGWAWKVIICFVVCFWTTYFCWGPSLGTGVGGGEYGAKSNFF